MKEAAKFTRDNPVTKVELHNAFWRTGQYRDTPVVDAKRIIGDNAPKYMLREDFISMETRGGVDWYILTDSGREWLRAGIARYLELHPERRSEVRGMETPVSLVRRRRT